MAMNPWAGLTFVLISFVFRVANATITYSELPAFESEFGVAGPTAELTLTLFLAIAGALIVPVGRLADRYGRVEVFTVGAIGMAAANLVSGLAPNFAILLGSRVLEAIAFPFMGAASLALLAGAFKDQEQRALAFSLYGASYGLALAIAAGIGGLFTQAVSWRWSFLMNVPILVGALIGVRATFPTGTGRHPETRLDVMGSLLLLGSVTGLLIAADRGPVDGWYSYAGLLLVAAVSLVIALAIHEWRRIDSDKPILFDVDLLRSPGFLAACVTSFLFVFGAFAVFTVMPLYWRLAGRHNSLAVGVGLMPVGIGWAIFAVLARPIGRRFGARRAVIGGLTVASIALLGTAAAVSDSGSTRVTLAPLFVLGCGLGLAYALVNEAALRDVPDRLTGLGSGMLIGFRWIAAGLGAVVLAQLLLVSGTFGARDAIKDTAGLTAAERVQAQQTIQAASRGRDTGLEELVKDSRMRAVLDGIESAYVTATRLTLLVGAAFVAGAALTGRRLPRDARSRP